jgi:CopG family nickel-responsive transcriptional regulator
MSDLTRFGVSLPTELLADFDRLLAELGYANRSEAVRDLIRDRLADEEWREGKGVVFGTITLVYDHSMGSLTNRLLDISHDHHDLIITNLHVHLDHEHCLEVLIVKGRAAEVRKLAGAIIGMRGILHGKLTLATTGKRLGEEKKTVITANKAWK